LGFIPAKALIGSAASLSIPSSSSTGALISIPYIIKAYFCAFSNFIYYYLATASYTNSFSPIFFSILSKIPPCPDI
jgi:hypothetical protein